VLTYISQQDFGKAHRFVEQARVDAPLHPLRRYVWQQQLDELNELLSTSELQAK
jgi:hypothetical protein